MAKKKPKQEAAPPAVPSKGAAAVSLSALREQAALLRHAQALARLAHVITGPDGAFETWSETLPRLIGIAPAEVVTSTRRWLDLVHPEDRARFRRTALEARAGAARAEVEYRIWKGGAGWIHVRQVMEPIPGPADATGRRRWFNTLQDITLEKTAEARIRRLNRLYATLSAFNALVVRVRDRAQLFHDACDVTVRHGGFRAAWIGVPEDGGRVRPVEWAGELGPLLAAPPQSLRELDPALPVAARAVAAGSPLLSRDASAESELLRALGVQSFAVIPLVVEGEVNGVLALYAADPSFFEDEELRLLADLAGDVAFGIQYLQKSERAEYLAYYDPVTNLANRALFLERLAEQLDAARLGRRKLGLLIIDIDRFKRVNDSLGRARGDALLRAVGERLAGLTPGRNIGRVGGDEFGIAIPDLRSAEDLLRGVQLRAAEHFGSPYRIEGEEIRLSARLGIALYPDDGADAETLFRNAEAALKKAKEAGEPFYFYESGMSERVAERLALEHRLHGAVERSEFLLHYQPKVSLATGAVTGAEALLRWNDPAHGPVPPLEFVPILEATGLIVPAGAWALRRAAADHAALRRAGLRAPRIAVNVSTVQLRHREFAASLEEAVRAGVSGEAVELEVTESVLMEDFDANIAKLRRARELGFRLAMDDFGTGYSSLAYLARLPVQVLKIDRAFVSRMHEDAHAMTLVATMVSLAHAMGLEVVAEGVETEDQARVLRELGCDEMQGYLVSRPLSLAALGQFLDRQP